MDPSLSVLMESQFFGLNVRIRNEKTKRQYRFAIANLREFLGREPTMGDLDDDTVTKLMVWLRDVRGLHPRTINDRRGRINTLWSWLANRGLTTRRPTNAALEVPHRTPRAWTEQQLRQLIQACHETPGTLCGLPLSTWLLAFHGLAWDTGARTTEILSLRWEWLDWENGWLSVPCEVRKAQRSDRVYRLMGDTLGLLRSFARPEGLILNYSCDQSRFHQVYKKLLIRAGLPATRYDQPQKLRRSHGSWLMAAGGDPTASLGHSSPATTRKAYLDPSIIAPSPAALLPFRLLGESG